MSCWILFVLQFVPLWSTICYFDYWLQAVEKLGCIRAIAISHPHFYSGMVAWGRQFNAPIYVHEVGREFDSTASFPPETCCPKPCCRTPPTASSTRPSMCTRWGSVLISQQHRSQVCKEAEAGARLPGHNGPAAVDCRVPVYIHAAPSKARYTCYSHRKVMGSVCACGGGTRVGWCAWNLHLAPTT